MILVLLGPPGAGKGTQGARIAVHYDIPAISTGALFRDAVQRGTRLGQTIQKYRIDKGEYVPDEVVVDAVRQRIAEPDCAAGFLVDGFPRTIPQADAFADMLAEQGLEVVGVLDFDAPINEIVGRFSGRRVCPADGSTYHVAVQPPLVPGLCDICKTPLVTRPDDEDAVVRRRLEVYQEKTAPLRDYYEHRGLLRRVDASAEPETVFAKVITVIEALRTRARSRADAANSSNELIQE
jgi:adenylate kinase